MGHYQAIAEAFRMSEKENRLLTELARRRVAAAKAEKDAAEKAKAARSDKVSGKK